MAKVSKKTKKDPNAPKKGLSAFMFFSQEKRQSIKEANPNATFGEMGKLLGAAWKELPEKDKEVYNAKAAKDKERFEKAMEEYKASGGSKKKEVDATVPEGEDEDDE